MGTVHLMLQGPGGVGKSFVATALVQGLEDAGVAVRGIDIDPANPTLCKFPGLPVEFLDVVTNLEIDRAKFDELMKLLFEYAAKGDVVVDSGGPTFVSLIGYLHTYQVADLLSEAGHKLVIHTVLAAGQSKKRAEECFVSLCENFSSVPLLVWLNPFRDGDQWATEEFEQTELYRRMRERVYTLVHLPRLDKLTTRDVNGMLTSNLTFAEALVKPDLHVMARHRLRMARDLLATTVEFGITSAWSAAAAMGNEQEGDDADSD